MSAHAIEVLPDVDRLAEAAARRFVTIGREAIRARGRFIVALSGGATPRSAYRRLASEPFRSQLDWSLVHVLWGDERCVPPEHASSNYRMARESLLDHVSVPAPNVHRIRGEDDPKSAAAAYESMLRALLRTPGGAPQTAPAHRIDLALLGLGIDGHTASIFPGARGGHGDDRWAVAVQAAPMWRVTLTPMVFNAAADVVFIVSGGDKAAIAREVLEGPPRPDELPAQRIAPAAGHLLWLLDTNAAADLRRIGR